jgi:hypothetical protein
MAIQGEPGFRRHDPMIAAQKQLLLEMRLERGDLWLSAGCAMRSVLAARDMLPVSTILTKLLSFLKSTLTFYLKLVAGSARNLEPNYRRPRPTANGPEPGATRLPNEPKWPGCRRRQPPDHDW